MRHERGSVLARTWLAVFLFGGIPDSRSSTDLPAQTLPKLTTMGETPEWRLLDHYQGRFTRQQFEKNLWVYSPDHAIYDFLDLNDEGLKLYSDREKTLPAWSLSFAKDPSWKPITPHRLPPAWQRKLIGTTSEKPLQGLRICLDPGHIGGEWSNLEERYFRIRKDPPVEEATLNILTCLHLDRLLSEAGAEVVWTKDNYEPVTTLRPEQLKWEGIQLLFRRNPKAYSKLSKSRLLSEARWHSELAFYRPAEIGARAKKVKALRPDLTICLHYNAAPWRNKKRPRLLKANKLVVFVLGTFMGDELEYDDQKFTLFGKLLEDSFDLESGLASSIGTAMGEGMRLPPENYTSWKVTSRVNDNPYVWSRNLLANRLFPGPTIFVEGPYMNDKDAYARLMAGDYDGEQEIGGQKVRSIYREYAESVAKGIIDYYRQGLTLPLE